MIDLMNKITDKQDWHRKVFDESIAQKWRQEALNAEEIDVSDQMFDWVRWILSFVVKLIRMSPCAALLSRPSAGQIKSLLKDFLLKRLSFLEFCVYMCI